MLRRSLALLPAALLCACSGPAAETPLPAVPAKTAAPTASASAPPPRKTNGTPVVLALRTPTASRGAEWAWLMPEGRLVTLAPPNAEGQRGVLGPNFFTGPDGAFVGIDQGGLLALAADGKVHKLGKFDQAAFDAKGQRVLVWNSVEWVLFGRDGERVDGVSMSIARPALLPSGGLVEHLGSAATTIVSASGKVREQVPMRCDEAFASAARLVCFDYSDGKDPKIVVVSLDTGKELGRFSIGSLKKPRPAVAFRADGGALALAGETIMVIELAKDGNKASSKTIHRRSPNVLWRVPRMGFTTDGKRLCVEEADETRVLDTAASEFKNGAPRGPRSKGTRTVCLFAQRGEPVSGPGEPVLANEWDALPVTVPVRDGWEPSARIMTSRYRVESEALSPDRKTAVLAENRLVEDGEVRRWIEQAVLLDAATGAVKRVIPLGTVGTNKWSSPPVPELAFSDDGSLLHVCAVRLIAEGCRDYSTATGQSTSPIPWPVPGASRTRFTVWSGEWPDAKAAPVLASLGLPAETKASVTSWSDEGRYVPVELDLGGGASVHLNLPDAPERVVRDVAAVAGGAMLGIVVQGAVELWTVQPLEIRAVLVSVSGGGAALFADNSVETIGDGEKALGCLKDEMVGPIDQCGDVRAAKGTLAALVQSAAAKKD